jgi:hypothetical protein
MLSVNGPLPDVMERAVLRTNSNQNATMFIVVAVAQLLDLVTFVPAVARVGIGAESNPLARTLYLSAGPLGPAGLKVAAIAIMLMFLARVMRRFPTYVVPSAALLIGIGLVGAGSNLLFGLLR